MKIRNIIVYQGINDSYKTTDLKELINKKRLFTSDFIKTDKSCEIVEYRENKNFNDSYALFVDKRDRKVLVISAGDCERDIRRYICHACKDFLLDKKTIDLLVVACRSKGSSIEYLKKLCKKSVFVSACRENHKSCRENLKKTIKETLRKI